MKQIICERILNVETNASIRLELNNNYTTRKPIIESNLDVTSISLDEIPKHIESIDILMGSIRYITIRKSDLCANKNIIRDFPLLMSRSECIVTELVFNFNKTMDYEYEEYDYMNTECEYFEEYKVWNNKIKLGTETKRVEIKLPNIEIITNENENEDEIRVSFWQDVQLNVEYHDDKCIKRYVKHHKLRPYNNDTLLSIAEIKTMIEQGVTFKIQNYAIYKDGVVTKMYRSF
jgi:hypothetical protein